MAEESVVCVSVNLVLIDLNSNTEQRYSRATVRKGCNAATIEKFINNFPSPIFPVRPRRLTIKK